MCTGRKLRCVAAWVIALLVGCDFGSDPEAKSGGLVIVVESDLSIPKDIDRVQLEVTQLGKTLLKVDEPLGEKRLLIPAEFRVDATGSSAPVKVHGLALLDGVPRIERSAVTPIPVGRVGVLRLPFRYLCDGTAETDGRSTCGGEDTCVLGSCRSAEVPSRDVEEYGGGSAGSGADRTVRGVMGGDGGTEGCFDLLACFASAQEVELDLDSCSFALGEAAPGRLNVALRLPSGGDGVCDDSACWVALDRDEGWSVDGDQVLLVESVCKKIAAGRPISVAASSACRAKSVSTPLCGEWSSAMTPIESPAPPPAIGDACAGAAARSCGDCGTQSRTCRNGKWSEYGACRNEGACAPDAMRSCEGDGAQVCGGDCAWRACEHSACEGAPARACGQCGNQERSCQAGQWSAWGECSGEGVCRPDDTRPCGSGGTQVCGGDCAWDGECSGQTCEGAETQACGACNLGTQTRVCDAQSATWSDWSACSGGGDCAPGEVRACGAGGTQTCGSDCEWLAACDGQACAGSSTQACGHCALGSQTRTCNASSATWSDWGTCSGGGECATSSTRGCGSGGTQTCGGDCAWGSACTGQFCSGPSSQACGHCGTQTRTCDSNTGAYSDWGPCTSEGVCAPANTQSCGIGGTQTCTDLCQWGDCTGQTCSGAASESCGHCGTRSRTCNNGVWSGFGQCTGETAAPPGAASGGYTFNTSNQGWTVDGVFDGASATRLNLNILGNAMWLDNNQEGVTYNTDAAGNSAGAARVIFSSGPPFGMPLGFAASSGSWRADLISPLLPDDSPFQNHARIRFAALERFTAGTLGTVNVQALFEVEKCDGATSFFRQVNGSGQAVFCAISNNAWTSCQFEIAVSNTQRIRRVHLRVFFPASPATFGDGAVIIDGIQVVN